MKKEQKEKNKVEGKNQIDMRKKEDKVLIGGVINLIPILLLIAIVISVFSIFLNTQNMSKNIDAELARAMEYDRVESGEEKTQGEDGQECPYVNFDAFFLRDLDGDNYAEGVRGTCKEIGTDDTLYMELNVLSKGYLEKGATITLNNDRNFYFETAIVKDNEIQDNYVGSNIGQIKLKEIHNGTQKLLTGIVKSGNNNYSSSQATAIGNNIHKYSYSEKYERANSIVFEGVHVIPAEESDTGVEVRTKIKKEIKFDVDWYGEVNCRIRSASQTNAFDGILDEEEGEVNLTFYIYLEDTKDQLNLKTSRIQATIPKLSNYDPKRVEVTNKNVNYHYENGILTASSEGTADDETGLITASPATSYKVVVTYPIEAYKAIGADSIEIRVPVEAQLTGYNNPNDEFQNPYESNIAKTTIVATYRNPVGEVARFDIYVGKYVYRNEGLSRYIVSKEKPLRMYNGLSDSETDDTFIVEWVGNTGSGANGGSMIFRDGKETQQNVDDVFITKSNSEESMADVSKTVGIFFSNPTGLLGENGEIRVYDNETNVLLQTFTNSNWYLYDEKSPFKFEMGINHLRVETSDVNKNASLSVYLVKELDDNSILDKYERKDFDNLEHIKSTLSGYLDEGHINDDSNTAWYEAPITEVGLSAKETAMTTQETYKNEVFTIHARYNENRNEVKWVNGVFLLKLPKEIIDVKINDVKIDNRSVELVSYEQFKEVEEKDEYRFIKIITENEEPTSYNITIDCDITPDPRIPTTSQAVKLYAYNENGIDYSNAVEDKYDVNDNLSTEDIIGSASINLRLISPQSLLTSETASKYDTEGSTAIAPQIAEIVKEQRDATIDINLSNNYTNTISEIKILVKIPSIGNTYTINGTSLDSDFDAYLQDGSIVLPDEFKSVAKIYYTDVVENLTKDINDPNNKWTPEKPANMKTVKAFLIDLGNYQMKIREQKNIQYKITIPTGLEYNQVSYSHHAVFFSLDTDNGKYRTQTEPNKLGFRLTKKFNLELTKYQTNKTRNVPGATYFIWEDIDEEETKEGRTKVTDAEGKFKLEGLYIGKTYCIKEIKTPVQYELNSDVVKFTTREEDDGTLVVEDLSDKNPKTITTMKDGDKEDSRYKVVIDVEDEVKGNLEILKKDRAGGTVVPNVKYRLKGKGFSSTGRILTTGKDGVINISGLSIGAEYTLEEIKAEGYYLDENPIKFKITNDGGVFKQEVTEGTVKEKSISEQDDIPTIHLELEDDKIPTYKLTIKKVEDGNPDRLLPGAKFRLIKDGKELGIYETGNDGENLGKIVIDNLYAFEDSKQIEQTYTLQEITAPLGYAKMQDVSFKVTKEGETFKLESVEGNISDVQAEGSNITITLEDSPAFKLTKVDDKESTILPGTKFVIYNVENGTVPARDSKGELVGVKEEIDGKEYYVLTTDGEGKITADLPQGLYKAVEVQASNEKYALADEIYFGIGMSKDSPVIFKSQAGVAIRGKDGISGAQQINSVYPIENDGYILGGQFSSASINLEDKDFENAGSSGGNDGMVIRVTDDNEVEWVSTISGNSNNDYITSVTRLSNGDYVAVGCFNSSTLTIKNNEGYPDQTIDNLQGAFDGIIIRYDNSGKATWAKAIGGTEQDGLQYVSATEDGGYVVGGYLHGTVTLDGSHTINSAGTQDGMIIKYSADNNVEWAKAIGSTNDDHITSVIETSDGGLLVGGDFQGEMQLDDVRISSNNSSIDGMVIKYNKVEGQEKYKAAWAKAIGGSGQDYIKAVTEIENGDYVVAGHFASSVNIEINKQNTTLSTSGSNDVIIVKYDEDGNGKWATSFGGSNAEVTTSMSKTSDGGFIVAGNFQSTTMRVGDTTLRSSGQDGFVVKYNENNEIKLVKGISGIGSGSEAINSVTQINSREYVVAGAFTSNSFQAGSETFTKGNASQVALAVRYMEEDIPNVIAKSVEKFGGNKDERVLASTPTLDGGYAVVGTFASISMSIDGNDLSNEGAEDAIIVKYNAEGKVEWVHSVGGTGSECMNSISQTVDGGYIVGGYFTSTSIDLDGYLLNNSNAKENGMLIRYNQDGEVIWATSIGENGENDRINAVVATEDGGYIIGGHFASAQIKIGDNNLTNSGKSDGIVAKYNSINQVEWVRQIKGSGDDQVSAIALSSDGGYIVGGKFDSTTIQVANKTLTKTTTQTTNTDGLVIKMSNSGEVESISAVGGEGADEITAVSSGDNNGYVVVGNFLSEKFTVGSFELTDVSGSSNKGDAMVIKYSSNNQVEWATSIGGDRTDQIGTVLKTADDGYIVAVNYMSSIVQIGDFTLVNSKTVSSNNYSDSIIAKYDEEGTVEWAISIGGSDGIEYINSIIETNDERFVAVGSMQSRSMQLGDFELQNEDQTTTAGRRTSEGLIIKLSEEPGIPEQSVFEVRNKLKTFKITTAVEINSKTNEKGGEISGEGKRPYETVEYGGESQKEIRMTPKEGYEIVRITINGVAQEIKQEYYQEKEYVLPSFKDMKEDKHIVVTYAPSITKFTINKKGAEGEPLAEAVFRIEQIEEDETLSEAIKPIKGIGQKYEEPDYEYDFDTDDKQLNNVLEEMSSNDETHNFVADGSSSTWPYKSNNESQDNTVANSFIKMNLSGMQNEKVAIVVDAEIDSEANYDCGYATITTTSEAPEYSEEDGQFINISGKVEAKKYVKILKVENTEYYLHFGYRKDESNSEGTDTFKINSVKVYPVKENTYNFNTESESKYVSSNSGKANTESNSYIEIDLTGKEGTYNVIVNAQIDSQENRDWGYAVIEKVTEEQEAHKPKYSNKDGRFIWISGKQEPADYTAVLEGNNKYYLYFGYHKDDNTKDEPKADAFTINSVKLVKNKSDEFSSEVRSDELGKAIENLEETKSYIITEIVAPEGYEKLCSAVIYTMKSEGNNEITVTDKKAPKLIVHHYLLETKDEPNPTEVAPEENYTGVMGETYETHPKAGLGEYELATDGKGGYIIEGEPNGTYTQDVVEVTYYYTTRKIPLIVHHYVEATNKPVPLATGGNAVDEKDQGVKGQDYTTNPLKDANDETEPDLNKKLNEAYELTVTPENAKGTYDYPEIEVTYEYDIKMYDITTKVVTHKEEQDVITEEGDVEKQQVDVAGGKISGEGKKPYEEVEHGGTSGEDDKQVKIEPDPGYQVKEGSIKVNGRALEPDEYDVGEDGIITLKPLQNVTEDKEIEVEFERIPAKVEVYHYIYDKSLSEPYTQQPVPFAPEFELELPEIIEGYIGKSYATKEIDEANLQEGYRLFEIPENSSGEMEEAVTQVKYYYELNTVKLTIEKTSDKTDQDVKIGDEITYTIVVRNSGNKAGKVVIKDEIPEGTIYKDKSLKVTVGEDVKEEYTIQDLTGEQGINIEVPGATNQEDSVVPGTVTVEFTVTVTGTKQEGKLANGEKIVNIATVDKDPENPDTEGKIETTPPVESTYVEPIIESAKEAKIIGKDGDEVKNRVYALEGESIEYTIVVINKGGLEKQVTVKDVLSEIEGITYDSSSKVKVVVGEEEQGEHTISQLESDEGIKVIVPKATDKDESGEITTDEYGRVTLTFKVEIDELGADVFEVQIKNTAKVDDKPTETTTTNVYKTNIIAEKTAEPDGSKNVTKGDKITYTITVNNSGSTDATVLVKDQIPEQVTFAGNVVVTPEQEEGKEYEEADLTEKGIRVTVSANSNVTISFDVTVNDLENGEQIKNVATIKEDPDNPESKEKKTGEVVHKYVEPNISAEKSAITGNGKEYVIAGERIKYVITLKNTGELEKEVIVKDIIPANTKFVEGSITVIPEHKDKPEEGYTTENLKNGIKVVVPAGEDKDQNGTIEESEIEAQNEIGKATVSFEVIVNEDAQGDIQNSATVNKDPKDPDDPETPGGTDEPTDPVVIPVVKYEKVAEVTRKEANTELQDNEVTVGDTIKYTIKVQNTGSIAVQNIVVKDKIPEGTELVENSIENNGAYNSEQKEITWTISEIAKETSAQVSFTVKVKYAIKDGTISNVATVDGNPTNETEKEYKKPTPELSNQMNKTATANKEEEHIQVLTEDGGAIKYNIAYAIEIKNYVGKAQVEIVDTLPAKLNVNKMKELAVQKGIETTNAQWLKEFLQGGSYDETLHTITWTEEINNIDTFTNGTYTDTISKEIVVVYLDQDVTEDLVNIAKGTTKLYYPDEDPENRGKVQIEETSQDEETVKQDYRVNLKVIKEWVDDNNRRDLQPQSIHISIKQEETNYTVEDYELNSSNNWTFDNTKLPGYSEADALPKYSDTGELLKYVVTEKETIDHYNSEIMELTPDVQEEATNYTVKVINTFELTEEEIKNAEITKEGTPETITSSTDEIQYTITYSAEITDYEGNATVVIEDELPYALDKEKMKVKASSKGIDTTKENWLEEYLDGGVYEEGTIGQSAVYKITWRISLGRINTYKQENETYTIEPITKTISLIYENLDATQEKIENTASGRVELDETQSPKEETTLETNVDIKGKLTVKYVDKETGKDLEEPQDSIGKVGDPYTTEEKQFDGYVLDDVEGERTGEYTEEDQTVTYYYTRPNSDVTVKYVDEDGNPLTDDVVIPGKVGDPYTTEEKHFDGYILERVEGNPEGTITEEDQEVVYVYKRIPAKVIVRYLEKGTNRELLVEDVINGYVGDDYTTQRKVIQLYRAAQPDPDNSSGKMRVITNPDDPNEIIDDTIIVTYYYERIPSGKIVVKHVDVDTGEEITYTEENEDGEKEEKTYGYDIEGYMGDKYETHEEDIPYYDVVKIPENASGEFSENEETVTYYYKKKPFNFSVEKVIKNVLLNGEQKDITNNKSMKVEIVAGTITYAQLEITYAIQVSNTGEIDGKAKVQELLPEGYKLINVEDYWKKTEDGNLEAEVELKAGETKELEVTLKWINGSSNFGPFDNTVKVTDTENEANFKDINPNDDTSTAEIITSIKTGEEISIIAIVTEVILILIIVLLTCIYYKKK